MSVAPEHSYQSLPAARSYDEFPTTNRATWVFPSDVNGINFNTFQVIGQGTNTDGHPVQHDLTQLFNKKFCLLQLKRGDIDLTEKTKSMTNTIAPMVPEMRDSNGNLAPTMINSYMPPQVHHLDYKNIPLSSQITPPGPISRILSGLNSRDSDLEARSRNIPVHGPIAPPKNIPSLSAEQTALNHTISQNRVDKAAVSKEEPASVPSVLDLQHSGVPPANSHVTALAGLSIRSNGSNHSATTVIDTARVSKEQITSILQRASDAASYVETLEKSRATADSHIKKALSSTFSVDNTSGAHKSSNITYPKNILMENGMEPLPRFIEPKRESMAEKLARQHCAEEAADKQAAVNQATCAISHKSGINSWAGIAVKGVGYEETKEINMRFKVPVVPEAPVRTFTRIGGAKSKTSAGRAEPVADQLRAILILNPPDSFSCGDISNGIHEGPLLAIREGKSPEDQKRFFLVVFQWAPSATSFFTIIETERIKNKPCRFGFIAHVRRADPYPLDKWLLAMDGPMFARRRLTLVKKGLFFSWRKPEILKFCYKHVGEGSVQYVHIYNGGNATICCTEVWATIKLYDVLHEMIRSGQDNSLYADLSVTFSKDPCEAEIRLLSDGNVQN